MSNEKWAHKDADGTFLDTQGWEASHLGNEGACWIPIHKNGKVVALVVATGDYDEIEGIVVENAQQIVDACNALDAPRAALPESPTIPADAAMSILKHALTPVRQAYLQECADEAQQAYERGDNSHDHKQ